LRFVSIFLLGKKLLEFVLIFGPKSGEGWSG